MQLLAHRGIWKRLDEKNSLQAILAAIDQGIGIETDIRDCDGSLVISHDPPRSTKRSADGKFVRPGKTEFAAIPSESVDYAALEHCPGSCFSVKMVQLDAGWNDLGAWDAVWNALPKDDKGNAHIGDVLTANSKNTLVHATSRLVSLVGVENLIVVETPDAVLVANKTRSQDVKHIVTQLQQTQREEHTLHRKVHRP